MTRYAGGGQGEYPAPVVWDITNDWHASTPTNPNPVLGDVIAQSVLYTYSISVDITDYVKSVFTSGADINGVVLGFTVLGDESNYYWGQYYPWASIELFYDDYKTDFRIYAFKETLASSTVNLYAILDTPPGKVINVIQYSWSINGGSTVHGQTITTTLDGWAWYNIECNVIVNYIDGTGDVRMNHVDIFNPGEPSTGIDEIDYQIKISNNYGKIPLTTYIEDITDYGVHNPQNWVWKISNGVTKIGKKIDVTFNESGIYSATMKALSEDETLIHEFKDIIFVLDDITIDGNQIELAHNSTETAMRHKISTEHTFNDDESSLSFILWSSEIDINTVGDDKVFSIKGNDTCEAKNVMPMVSDAFKMGSESSRWASVVSDESESELNQSKSLRLWGGR
jgi:hypothetical protein